MKNIAVILSGGIGSRMGLNMPKQYVMVDEKPIISYCVKQFLGNSFTDALVIVVANDWRSFVSQHISKLYPQKPVYYAEIILVAILLLHDDDVHNLFLHLIHHARAYQTSVGSLLFFLFCNVVLCHFTSRIVD